MKKSASGPHTYNNIFYISRAASNKNMRLKEVMEMAEKRGLIGFDTVPCEAFDYQEDFDIDKLLSFLKMAGLELPKEGEVLLPLENLQVARVDSEKRLIFTNAGVLFFAKNVGRIFPHAIVSCALYQGRDKATKIIDSIILNMDIISAIKEAMVFLQKSLRLEYRIVSGQLQREEVLEIPENALREALINAVTHRDYLNKRTDVTVEVYSNRVEISNYGGLPEDLDEKDFGKKSVLRNRLIADLMHRAKYVEKFGTGIQKMKKLVKQAGLPPVKFEFSKFFTVIFKRKVYRTAKNKHSLFKQSQRVLKLLLSIKNSTFSKATFAENEGISKRAVERDIKALKDQGLIDFEGGTRTGRYKITGKIAVIRIFVEKAQIATGLDAHVHAKELVELTGIDIDNVMRIIKELEQENLIHVELKKEGEETLIYADELLFTRFDHLWKPWNPVDDARQIATSFSHYPDFTTDPERVSEILNLPPRRFNPAIRYLIEHGLIEVHKAQGTAPFTVSRIYPRRENIEVFLNKI